MTYYGSRSGLSFALIPLLSFLLTTPSFSQQYRGMVTDSLTGGAMAGAQVVSDTGAGTYAEADGSFLINPGPGAASLTISYLGYEPLEILLEGREPNLGTVQLQRSNTALDEVIVSASARNYDPMVKGSNFTVAPATLEKTNPLSAEELLRTVPGVNIVGDMGLSNRPNISIRGSWGRRSKKVLLLEDGTPSAPAPYIAPGAYYNPVIDRVTAIEVYKGADLLRYGPNNMYGAINYVTALPPQQPELRVKLIGGQRAYTTSLLSYGGTWNGLGALVEGVYKSFDGFTDHSSVEVLNLNAKVFARLSGDQSLYFKVSGQYEDNRASLSSQTPFTFEVDPTQNPLDADQFTMRRYGLDLIHKWLPQKGLSLTSKLYATDFERDWWRQVTAKVPASEVRSYVGDAIYEERYRYLDGLSPGPEDYLIVGRVLNGREATTDSRWTYTVTGFKETLNLDWEAFGGSHHLEGGANFHRETFKDQFLEADSTRWARTGTTTKDLKYRLWALNGFIRNSFDLGRWMATPILRVEHVNMYRQDLIAQSLDPTLQGTAAGRETNAYTQLLPGLTLEYHLARGQLFASVYEGMIAPSKVFGFLVEQDGVVTNPLAGESINIKPELAWNSEFGWRGSSAHGKISGQATYFNNTSRNFYAGGRNEVFSKLGRINVQGLEVALDAEILNRGELAVRAFGNLTLLRSRVKAGELEDRDLFSQVIHSSRTRNEYLNLVNTHRSAFDVYVSDGAGGELLFTGNTLTAADFGNITRSMVRFGAGGGLAGAEAPYTPPINATAGLEATKGAWSAGMSGTFVGKQFTEFHNFRSESADGAIGRLPAYFTLDAFFKYDFRPSDAIRARAFINGKNITNQVYRASRLNRATSGIFPGGFRQWIVGIDLHI